MEELIPDEVLNFWWKLLVTANSSPTLLYISFNLSYFSRSSSVLATEQRMSEKELKRRQRSGVTSSETILSAISCLQINKKADYQHPSQLLGIASDIQEFSVQLSSPYFSCPDSISIPVDVSASSCKFYTNSLSFSFPINPSFSNKFLKKWIFAHLTY